MVSLLEDVRYKYSLIAREFCISAVADYCLFNLLEQASIGMGDLKDSLSKLDFICEEFRLHSEVYPRMEKLLERLYDGS